jgi:hypothetical protein
MENNTADKEVLVLTDDSGTYYAIPIEALERYRVTEEQKAQIEGLLGSDVSGYAMFEQMMMEHRISQNQADRMDEAERERMIRSSKESTDGEAKPLQARGLFTGLVATLRSINRSAPEEA